MDPFSRFFCVFAFCQILSNGLQHKKLVCLQVLGGRPHHRVTFLRGSLGKECFLSLSRSLSLSLALSLSLSSARELSAGMSTPVEVLSPARTRKSKIKSLLKPGTNTELLLLLPLPLPRLRLREEGGERGGG